MTTFAKVMPSAHRSPQTNAYYAIALSLAAFAMVSIFIRYSLAGGIPPTVLSFGRLFFASLLLTPFVLRRHSSQLRQLTRRDIFWVAGAGFFIGIHFIFVIASLEYTSVLTNQVFNGMSPLWVGLLEVIFLKARLKPVIWFGLFMAIIGGIIIAFAGDQGVALTPGMEEVNDALGIGLGVLAAFAGALYVIFSRKSRLTVPILPFVWMAYSFGALTTLAVVVIQSTPLIGYSAEGYFWMLMLTLIPQLIGHSSVNFALGHLPATVVSVASQLLIVISAVMGFIVFHEIPQPLQLVGSVIVTAGVLLAILGQPKQN